MLNPEGLHCLQVSTSSDQHILLYKFNLRLVVDRVMPRSKEELKLLILCNLVSTHHRHDFVLRTQL